MVYRIPSCTAASPALSLLQPEKMAAGNTGELNTAHSEYKCGCSDCSGVCVDQNEPQKVKYTGLKINKR